MNKSTQDIKEMAMMYNRREFLKSGGAAFAGTCIGGLCLQSCSPFGNVSRTASAPAESYTIESGRIKIDLEKVPDLTANGGSIKLKFNHPDHGTLTKIILIHPENSSFLAFANTCTHKGKELEYDHPARRIHCVSGHSEFNLNGKVLDGNAEKPLKGYPIKIVGNILYIEI